MEEWNEYGELKDNVGTGAAIPPISTPSAPSTPSKAPQSADTPSKVSLSAATPPRPQQPSTTDSPLTTAMRQAGFEAAKKAGEARSQARAKAFGDSKASNDALKKLDNSTVTGLPPPTGTTEANSAKAPETRSSTGESKADTLLANPSGTRGKDTLQLRSSKVGGSKSSVNPNEKTRSREDGDNEGDEEDSLPQRSAIEQSTSQSETSDKKAKSRDHPGSEKTSQQELNPEPGDVDIVKLLKEQGKTGGPLLDLRKLNTGKAAATSATTIEEVHRAQPSSGKKTQDQAAGDGELAGVSVGD